MNFSDFVSSVTAHISQGYRFSDCSAFSDRNPVGTRYVHGLDNITGVSLRGYRADDDARVALRYDGDLDESHIVELENVGVRFNDTP